MGPVEITVDQDLTDENITELQKAFDELEGSYPDVDDRGLAQAVFFNWFPGSSVEDLVAATVVQLGHHG
jgi:hypothetical protein